MRQFPFLERKFLFSAPVVDVVNGPGRGVDRDHVVTTTPLSVLSGPDLRTQSSTWPVARVPGAPVTDR